MVPQAYPPWDREFLEAYEGVYRGTSVAGSPTLRRSVEGSSPPLPAVVIAVGSVQADRGRKCRRDGELGGIQIDGPWTAEPAESATEATRSTDYGPRVSDRIRRPRLQAGAPTELHNEPVAVGGGEYSEAGERRGVEIDQMWIDSGERLGKRVVDAPLAAQLIGGETDQGLRRDDRRGGERAAEAQSDRRVGSGLCGDRDREKGEARERRDDELARDETLRACRIPCCRYSSGRCGLLSRPPAAPT